MLLLVSVIIAVFEIAPSIGKPAFSFFHQRYFNTLPHIPITWTIVKPSVFLDFDYVFHTLSLAFDQWENEANLNFKYLRPNEKPSNPSAHIIITFEQNNIHTLSTSDTPCLFGAKNVIAHAYYPPIHEIHFRDVNDYYQTQRYKYGPSLFLTAMHEIGHILGFKHSYSKRSIMYYAADLTRPNHYKVYPLAREDKQRAVNVYGKKLTIFGFKL